MKTAYGLTAFLTATAMIAACDSMIDNDSEISLFVSANSIEFDENDPENNRFIVTSSADWYAECDNHSLVFSPETGQSGDVVVEITEMEPGSSGTITITTRRRKPDDAVKSETVKVTRAASGETEDPENPDDPDDPDDEPPMPEVLIYYDDLDREVSSSATYLDEWDGYINAEGAGAANVSYSGQGISIRSSFQSSGYEGASGGNAMNYGYDDRTVLISGITVDGITRMEFSFGVTPPPGASVQAGENIRLHIGFDGNSALTDELDFTATKGSGQWYLASAAFEIIGGLPSEVNFTIWAASKNTKIDDFRLASTSKTVSQTVTYTQKDDNVPWPELPEERVYNSSYKYVTHWAETGVTGKRVRNYSACYDTERHNPVWVAYPMHQCYLELGFERTTPDPWRPDPEFEESEQSVIYGSDWADWPWGGNDMSYDRYQYWSSPQGIRLTRGHLLRSADRGGHNTLMNIQTFYPTNIAPENYLYPDVHEDLEYALPDEWMCADTIYVVSGCYYDNDNIFAYDASYNYEASGLSKECDIPTAQYKIYLRTKKGNTGKRICDCTADELTAIGFWLPQNLDGSPARTGGNLADFACSVDEIERMTGNEFEFFPEAPDEVTSGYRLSDWGL